MRGTILGVHDGRGVLLAVDDRRLDFPLSEWRSTGTPVAGQVVDFMEEGGQARGVFAVPGGAASVSQSHSSSFVLSAVALGCLALGFIIPLVPTIAAFVLGVIGANQARAQGDETALTMARVAWIGALVLLVIGALAILAVIAFVGTIGLASMFQLGPGDF
ncbi:MAG TPA: hypothetical protein VEA80_11755 [Vitreimonas sp.]|uniref:hypothetical protein n=1 Tax=Vitreimonas sp. TaxID=3069702 RepID=UPI002D5A1D63|nr:hypothetical protein [Vitreimonas sp.]HYD88144.1 hypothetical protein [Vitreimonas sp.]